MGGGKPLGPGPVADGGTMKTCKACGHTGPLDDFPIDRTGMDGRRGQCLPCNRLRSKKWRGTDSMKICNGCGTNKTVGEFARGGVQTRCKECTAAYRERRRLDSRDARAMDSPEYDADRDLAMRKSRLPSHRSVPRSVKDVTPRGYSEATGVAVEDARLILKGELIPTRRGETLGVLLAGPMAPGRESPACSELPDAWFSMDPSVQYAASRTCLACPVRAQCLSKAIDQAETSGVWGGMLFG